MQCTEILGVGVITTWPPRDSQAELVQLEMRTSR